MIDEDLIAHRVYNSDRYNQDNTISDSRLEFFDLKKLPETINENLDDHYNLILRDEIRIGSYKLPSILGDDYKVIIDEVKDRAYFPVSTMGILSVELNSAAEGL